MALRANITANYLGQIWIAGMGLIFIPLYVKLLGMEAYGLIGFFAMLQAWFSILDLGMTPTINREMARYRSGRKSLTEIRSLLRTLEITALAVGVVALLIIMSVSGFLAYYWLKPQSLNASAVQHSLAIIAVIVGLRILEGIYRGALNGLESQVLLNVLSCLVATLKFAAVIPWLYLRPTLGTFFGWQLLIAVFSVFTFAFFVNRSLPRAEEKIRFSWIELQSNWRFSGGMLRMTLMALLLSHMDKFILSRCLPLQDLGLYTLAATVAGSLSMVVSPVSTAYFPRLVQLQENQSQGSFAETFHQGCQLITILVTPLAMLMIFYGQELIYFWSQDLQLSQRTGRLVPLLAIGYLLHAIVSLPLQSQIAHGWTNLNFRLNVVALATLTPLLWFIVPRYGTVGAACAWIGLNSYFFLATAYFMFRRILVGERLSWCMHDLLLPLFGVVGLCWFVSLAGPYTYLARPVGVIMLAAVGCTATLIATCLANTIRPHLWKLFSKLSLWPS